MHQVASKPLAIRLAYFDSTYDALAFPFVSGALCHQTQILSRASLETTYGLYIYGACYGKLKRYYAEYRFR